eukprot:376087-Prymnesium_polylepis.1
MVVEGGGATGLAALLPGGPLDRQVPRHAEHAAAHTLHLPPPLARQQLGAVLLLNRCRFPAAVPLLYRRRCTAPPAARRAAAPPHVHAASPNATPQDMKGKNVVVPLCGGNIDVNVLGRVIERGLAADGRLV